MAIIKICCPKCGQKVSGDESYYGRVVECPVCSSDIRFPGERKEGWPSEQSSARATGESFADPVPIPPKKEEKKAYFSEDDQTAGESDEEDATEVPSPLWGSISIVSGVLAIVTCIGGVIFAPLAIAFGHTALARARRSEVQPAPGQTLGAVGLTIGYASLVSTLLILIVAVYFKDSIQEWIHTRFSE